MDNIQMFEKAMEIQEAWKPQDGDWYCERGGGVPHLIMWDLAKHWTTATLKTYFFWLATQEQLQGMLEWWALNKWSFNGRDDFFLEVHAEELSKGFWGNSAVKVLIQGVMWQKHHKVWIGADWVPL